MLIALGKWRVTAQFKDYNVRFTVSDNYYQNVLRKVADLEWEDTPISITIQFVTPATPMAGVVATGQMAGQVVSEEPTYVS